MGKKVSIAIISPEYPPKTNWGGIATFNKNLAKLLSKHGVDVHVITFDGKGRNARKVVFSKKLTIHYVLYRSNSKLFNFLYFSVFNQFARTILTRLFPTTTQIVEWNLFSFLTFKRLYQETRFSAIHSVGYFAPSLLINAVFKDIPLIFHIQGYQRIIRKKYERFSIDALIHSAVEEFYLSRFGSVYVACSKSIKDAVLKYHPTIAEKMCVIHNFISLSAYENRQKLNKDNLVFVGRFEYRKGIDILIKTFIKIASSNVKINLYLIGNSNFLIKKNGVFIKFKSWLKSLNIHPNIVQRIHIISQIDDERKLRKLLIKLKGVGVVPSRHEPFGFVIIELMTIGYVTVATKGEGGEEIIDDQVDGYLSKANESSLSFVLNNILQKNTSQELQTISKNARIKVNHHFTDKNVFIKYKRIYKRLKINE